MTDRLEKLVSNLNENPLLVVDITAIYLQLAATGKVASIKTYQKIIKDNFTELSEKLPMVRPQLNLIDGMANFYLTKYSEAEQDLKRALDEFKPGMPKDILGAIHMAMGANYRSLGEIDLAVENEYQAVGLIDKNGRFAITYAYAYYQLGELHLSIGEYENALEYFKKALKVIIEHDDNTASFRINNGLGTCYLYLNDFNKSLEYLNTALSLVGLSAAEESRGLCDLGLVKFKQGKLNEAERYLNRSLEIRKENSLEDASSTSLLHLGSLLLTKNKEKKAVIVLDEALAIANKFNALGKKIKIYKLLALANQKLDHTQLALEYFNRYDSLNNEVRTEQEHKIFRLKNKQIENQRELLRHKNIQLKDTLDELAKVKNSRKSLFFSIGTAIVLVILTEAFFDPFIDSHAYNVYLSLAVKVIIALLLKPMESFYERILFRKAMKLT